MPTKSNIQKPRRNLGGGGLVSESDKACDYLALRKLHEDWSARIVAIESLTSGEEMQNLSVNHPYFKVRELDQRDALLDILSEAVETINVLAKKMGGRPRVHANNAEKHKAYRERKNGQTKLSA